ncbi:MAG: Hpt domain-containing protein [Pseudomonadota bacterium]
MIDWNRVQELRDEIGAEDFAEIAVLFLSEIEEAAEGLPTITDPTARSEALHGMKGSAMNLGFQAFANICKEGEVNPGSVDFGGLTDTLGQSVAALKSKFPELA